MINKSNRPSHASKPKSRSSHGVGASFSSVFGHSTIGHNTHHHGGFGSNHHHHSGFGSDHHHHSGFGSDHHHHSGFGSSHHHHSSIHSHSSFHDSFGHRDRMFNDRKKSAFRPDYNKIKEPHRTAFGIFGIDMEDLYDIYGYQITIFHPIHEPVFNNWGERILMTPLELAEIIDEYRRKNRW